MARVMNPLSALQAKIQTPQEIAHAFSAIRGQYPLVTTNGCFDLLHLGHIKLLTHCASLSPYTIVLINSDTSIKKLKGPSRPLQDEKTRALILASLSYVWRVSVFTQDTPLSHLEVLRPDIHVKGSEYKNQNIPEESLMRQLGGRVEFFNLEPGYSTTALIQKIKNIAS